MKNACFMLILLNFLFLSSANTLFQKFTDGIQMAGKFLDFEQHSKTLANMISKAFNNKFHNMNENNELKEKEHVFSGFLRLLGFGPRKLGAVVINAVIFIAQLVSSSFSEKYPLDLTHERKLNESSIFDWILSNAKTSHLLDYAKSQNLTENIINNLRDISLDEDTGCLQLLICRCSPFVKKMQEVITSGSHFKNGLDAFFEFLPTRKKILENGIECEKEYPYCKI